MRRQDSACRSDLLKARDRIGGWLCEAPLRHAPDLELGGVAGRLSVSGEPEFHYGEIAGYWLSWAALYAPNSNLMTAVVNWLDRQWSGPYPAATRIGVRGDWRNQGVSSFDLAIIVRGLADAAPFVGEAACGRVAARIAGWLDRMVGVDGRLDPWLVLTQSDFQIAGRLAAALIRSRLQRRSSVRPPAGFRTASFERLKKQLMPGLREWTSNWSGTHGSTPWKASHGCVPTSARKSVLITPWDFCPNKLDRRVANRAPTSRPRRYDCFALTHGHRMPSACS